MKNEHVNKQIKCTVICTTMDLYLKYRDCICQKIVWGKSQESLPWEQDFFAGDDT